MLLETEVDCLQLTTCLVYVAIYDATKIQIKKLYNIKTKIIT